MVVVRAAARVRAAEALTVDATVSASFSTVSATLAATTLASSAADLMVALAARSVDTAALRAVVTAPLPAATVVSTCDLRSCVERVVRMRCTRASPRSASSSTVA